MDDAGLRVLPHPLADRQPAWQAFESGKAAQIVVLPQPEAPNRAVMPRIGALNATSRWKAPSVDLKLPSLLIQRRCCTSAAKREIMRDFRKYIGEQAAIVLRIYEADRLGPFPKDGLAKLWKLFEAVRDGQKVVTRQLPHLA